MPLSDADYQEVKRRLAQDTLSVAVLHVRGDLDCANLLPRRPIRVQAGSFLFSGTGAPAATLGNNRDFYFRTDGGASTCIYQKRSGSWVATGA
jgi:hypothetical protein